MQKLPSQTNGSAKIVLCLHSVNNSSTPNLTFTLANTAPDLLTQGNPPLPQWVSSDLCPILSPYTDTTPHSAMQGSILKPYASKESMLPWFEVVTEGSGTEPQRIPGHALPHLDSFPFLCFPICETQTANRNLSVPLRKVPASYVQAFEGGIHRTWGVGGGFWMTAFTGVQSSIVHYCCNQGCQLQKYCKMLAGLQLKGEKKPQTTQGKWLISPPSPITLLLTTCPCSAALTCTACHGRILHRCKALAEPAMRHPVFPTTLPNSSTFLRGFIRRNVPLKRYSKRS